MTMTNPSNDNATRWTAERWALHLRNHHPAHAAASYAKHREEMGRLAPAARVITALSMEGKLWSKADALPLSFDQALAKIDEASERRAAKRAA
jgi:hypothetical protein